MGVIGQLTVDRAAGAGFVTAYGCADGLPTDADGTISRSDLNFDGAVSPVSSNRLIVKADTNGDVCFYTLQPAALIIDINAVSDVGISSFPNQRTDSRKNQSRLPNQRTNRRKNQSRLRNQRTHRRKNQSRLVGSSTRTLGCAILTACATGQRTFFYLLLTSHQGVILPHPQSAQAPEHSDVRSSQLATQAR